MNSSYQQLMIDAIELHDRKSHDYAQERNKYSNFTRAAELTGTFKDPVDQVFASMIGIKLARLAELLNGKEPKNESIRDSFVDLVNYAALWGSFHDEHSHFICPKCKGSFKYASALANHKETHHAEVTTLKSALNGPQCSCCGFIATSSKSMHNHICYSERTRNEIQNSRKETL